MAALHGCHLSEATRNPKGRSEQDAHCFRVLRRRNQSYWSNALSADKREWWRLQAFRTITIDCRSSRIKNSAISPGRSVRSSSCTVQRRLSAMTPSSVVSLTSTTRILPHPLDLGDQAFEPSFGAETVAHETRGVEVRRWPHGTQRPLVFGRDRRSASWRRDDGAVSLSTQKTRGKTLTPSGSLPLRHLQVILERHKTPCKWE